MLPLESAFISNDACDQKLARVLPMKRLLFPPDTKTPKLGDVAPLVDLLELAGMHPTKVLWLYC